MSWYFFGGFSAYLIVPSGECRNHSGWARTCGWSGAAWMARSIASSMPLRLDRLAKVQELAQSTELRAPRRRVRRRMSRWRTATRRRPAPASSVLLRPLRFVRPIGWIGGTYTTSKPMAAICGRRHSASAKVVAPGRSGSRPCERGKSSYQAPNRARSRSTISGSSGRARGEAEVGVVPHGGQQVLADRIAAARVASERARFSAPSAARMRSASSPASASSVRRSAASSSRRPSSSSFGTATPASSFLRRPSRHEPKRVAPGLDHVGVPPVAEQLDVTRPAVVVDRPHRRASPGSLVVRTEQDRRVEQVVAVGEDVRGHQQLVADDALDRVAAAVQLRGDALDDDAAPAADSPRPPARAGAATVAIARRTLAFVVVMDVRNPTRSNAGSARRAKSATIDVDAALRRSRPAACSSRRSWLRAARRPPRVVAADASASVRRATAPTDSHRRRGASAAPSRAGADCRRPAAARARDGGRRPGRTRSASRPHPAAGCSSTSGAAGSSPSIPGRGERRSRSTSEIASVGEGERGLLGLVLHPDWPADGRAFVHYSDRNGDTVLSEFAGSQDGDAAPVLDPGQRGGAAHRRPAVPEPQRRPARLRAGRLPVVRARRRRLRRRSARQRPESGDRCSVRHPAPRRLQRPGPTPSPTTTRSRTARGGAPEIYLFGLRNPWRFSFDPETGALWIADVGQNAYEEVDRIDPVADAGANLGWNLMEASHCFEGRGVLVRGTGPAAGRVRPRPGLLGHRRATSTAAPRSTVWRGWYVFGDYCTGLLFGIRSDAAGSRPTAPHWRRASCSSPVCPISSFGTDSDGELYLTDYRRRRALADRGRRLTEGTERTQRGPSAAPDHQVVEQLDVEQPPGLRQLGRDAQVLAGGLRGRRTDGCAPR